MKLRPVRSGGVYVDTSLVGHTVHLWLCDLELNSRQHGNLCSILDDSERDRALRFRLLEHRERFVACRGQLRLLLSFYMGQQPAKIGFEQGQYGKPRLVDTELDQGLVFNVSHSSNKALLAFGTSQLLGVDLELWREVSNVDAMVERCFSAKEKSAWLGAEEACRQTLFFSFWTAKEAMIKAEGQGLSLGVQRCELSHNPHLRYTSLPACCGDPIDWKLFSIDCGERFSGALAVKSKRCKVIYRELSKDWLFSLYFPAAVG